MNFLNSPHCSLTPRAISSVIKIPVLVCWFVLKLYPSVLIRKGALSKCANQYFNCSSPFKEVSLPEDSIAIIRVLKTKNQRRPAANLAPYKNVIAFLEISAKLDGFDHKTYHTSYHIIWCSIKLGGFEPVDADKDHQYNHKPYHISYHHIYIINVPTNFVGLSRLMLTRTISRPMPSLVLT